MVELSTVTLALSLADPQVPEVYFTIYEVVDAGLTVMLCVVAPPGVQL